MILYSKSQTPIGYIWSINLILGSFESSNILLYVANCANSYIFYSVFNFKFLEGDTYYFIVIAHL